MMPEVNVFGIAISAWIAIPIAFFVWVTALHFVKKRLFTIIKKLTGRTANKLDDIFIKAANFPMRNRLKVKNKLIYEQGD